MTNASQAVTASLTLSAFGQTVASTGSSTSAYGFGATSGYRTEGEAGLTLVGCRFYDAQVGRFITRDTVLTEKPYAYCDGDPVNGVDPSGHWVVSIGGPGGSISCGPIHIDLGVGIAVQGPGAGASGWGWEGYGSGKVGVGGGLGVSVGPIGPIGLGYGNLGGFNGVSVGITGIAQPVSAVSVDTTLNGTYTGVSVGLPRGGVEAGIYATVGYTQRLFGGGSSS